MNKKYLIIICLIVIILIGITGFIYYKYYYPYSGNASTISEKELKCGGYLGTYTQKKPGTPDDWVWHSAGKSSVWVTLNSSISCLS